MGDRFDIESEKKRARRNNLGGTRSNPMPDKPMSDRHKTMLESMKHGVRLEEDKHMDEVMREFDKKYTPLEGAPGGSRFMHEENRKYFKSACRSYARKVVEQAKKELSGGLMSFGPDAGSEYDEGSGEIESDKIFQAILDRLDKEPT